MKILLIIAAIIVVVILVIRMAVRTAMQRLLDSPQFKQAVAQQQRRQEAEEKVLEQAPWFGRTGLPESLERELPRYLRREFGESIFDDGALQAADLVYLGTFHEDGVTVRYWSIPGRTEHPCYASIELDASGQASTGWGNREPPPALLPDSRES